MAAAAVAAGGRQSHWAGWLEQNLDFLVVSDAFGRFRAILTFCNIFCRFGMFFDVFGRFWSVSVLGFGPGNNPVSRHLDQTTTRLSLSHAATPPQLKEKYFRIEY